MTNKGADEGRAQALRDIDRDLPPWHAWEGVIAGLVYARRPQTSPPMVVRAVTVRLKHPHPPAGHLFG